jgi:tellurite resistance protein
MRPKSVLALLAVILLVLAAAFFLNQLLTRHSAGPTRPAAPTSALTTPKRAAATVPGRAKAETTGLPPTAANALTPEQRQAAIDAEVTHLQELSVNDDADSLSAILKDLTSSKKDVRLAAIEAARQFGSRDAIPVLKAAAGGARDEEERKAMLAVADFLELPTIADSSVQLKRTPEEIEAAKQKQAQRQLRNPRPGTQYIPQTSPGDTAPGR